jgi:hypothetical protein
MSVGNGWDSVYDVWAWWAVSAVAVAGMLYHAASGCTWTRVKDFFAGERGSSYVLPYVLTFPIYFLLICILIQATMILMVKMGTQYAAYAAARAAIVWHAVEPDARSSSGSYTQARSMAHRAAVAALTPFAPGDPKFLNTMFPFAALDGPSIIRADAYYEVYRRLDQNNVGRDDASPSGFIRSPDRLAPASYVKTKYRFAHAATDLALSPQHPVWNQDVRAEVSYEMPMHLPAAGRILGTWSKSSRFYSRTIAATATMPSETPDSATRRLGIDYRSEPLR